jgi:hypothetical protein
MAALEMTMSVRAALASEKMSVTVKTALDCIGDDHIRHSPPCSARHGCPLRPQQHAAVRIRAPHGPGSSGFRLDSLYLQTTHCRLKTRSFKMRYKFVVPSDSRNHFELKLRCFARKENARKEIQ